MPDVPFYQVEDAMDYAENMGEPTDTLAQYIDSIVNPATLPRTYWYPKSTAVLHADCTRALPSLPIESADLVFADPPFNIGYEYDAYDDTKPTDEYLFWCETWLRQVHRVCKPAGTFWLAIGDKYVSELDVLAKRIGFFKQAHVVWYYTFGVNCKSRFSRSHTHLLHYTKSQTGYTFNVDAIRVPSARQAVYKDKRANSKGRLPDDTWILRPQQLPDGFSPDSDTWHVPRVAGTFKERQKDAPTQMPEEVLKRIILVSSNPGELVLDPFSGTGTTAVVAKQLGRKCLAFEVSEKWVQAGNRRISEVQQVEEVAV